MTRHDGVDELLTIDTQGRVPYAAPARASDAATERCVAAAFAEVDLGEPASAPRTIVLRVPRDWRPAEPGPHAVGIEAGDVGAAAGLDATSELAARSALDARRDAVLGCAGTATVALAADVGADGALTVTLRGALAGSAEERCVQATLAGLAIAPPAAPGALIHVITAAE